MRACLSLLALLLTWACPTWADPLPARNIGVVVMHGKGGSPTRWVAPLAQALSEAGFQVANLEMPWSGKRQYDVDMKTAAAEISAALDDMKARGAERLFVAGHSQGGLFALYYGGLRPVDGLIAIAPGGSHGARVFRDNLGAQVAKAREKIAAGAGDEKERFADFEGAKGSFPVITTATLYLDWFNPDGPHNMDYVTRRVLPATPVLYLSPSRDYPALKRDAPLDYQSLPANPLSRFATPDSDHLNAPANASAEIIRWIRDVAGR